MIKLCQALNLREAHLIAGYLEDRGLEVDVRGGAHHAVRGELVIPELLPGLWVDGEAAAETGKALLADYFERLKHETEGEAWVCASCAEAHEPQFGSCWKCGAARPA